MNKPYKAVVVCIDPENGVLFARRADSVLEADHIVFDDIMRIMDDYETKVTLENHRDGYGEWITTATYSSNNEEEPNNTLEYKLCFDEPEKESEKQE